MDDGAALVGMEPSTGTGLLRGTTPTNMHSIARMHQESRCQIWCCESVGPYRGTKSTTDPSRPTLNDDPQESSSNLCTQSELPMIWLSPIQGQKRVRSKQAHHQCDLAVNGIRPNGIWGSISRCIDPLPPERLHAFG